MTENLKPKNKSMVKLQSKRMNNEKNLSDTANTVDLVNEAPSGTYIRNHEHTGDSGLDSSHDDGGYVQSASESGGKSSRKPAKSFQKTASVSNQKNIISNSPDQRWNNLTRSITGMSNANITEFTKSDHAVKETMRAPVAESAKYSKKTGGISKQKKIISKSPDQRGTSAKRSITGMSYADVVASAKSDDVVEKTIRPPIHKLKDKPVKSAGTRTSVTAKNSVIKALRFKDISSVGRNTGECSNDAAAGSSTDDYAFTKSQSNPCAESERQVTKTLRKTAKTTVTNKLSFAEETDSSTSTDCISNTVNALIIRHMDTDDTSTAQDDESEDGTQQLNLSDIDADADIMSTADGSLLRRKDPYDGNHIADEDLSNKCAELMNEMEKIEMEEEEYYEKHANKAGSKNEPYSPADFCNRRILKQMKLLQMMNFRLQQKLLIRYNHIEATIKSVDLQARQELQERINSGVQMKVGCMNYLTDKIHAGYGYWIKKRDYDDLRTKSALTPNKFMGNLAVLIFTEHTLKNSSVTGRVSNAHRFKDGRRVAAKPPLKPEGLDAVAALTRYWLETGKKKYTETEILEALSGLRMAIAKKIAEMNRPPKSKYKETTTGNKSGARAHQITKETGSREEDDPEEYNREENDPEEDDPEDDREEDPEDDREEHPEDDREEDDREEDNQEEEDAEEEDTEEEDMEEEDTEEDGQEEDSQKNDQEEEDLEVQALADEKVLSTNDMVVNEEEAERSTVGDVLPDATYTNEKRRAEPDMVAQEDALIGSDHKVHEDTENAEQNKKQKKRAADDSDEVPPILKKVRIETSPES